MSAKWLIIFCQGKKCNCNPEKGCFGKIYYGSDGEVNKQLSINITKVLVPPGTVPYEPYIHGVWGANNSHDFALAVLEKNFDEVFGVSLGKQG